MPPCCRRHPRHARCPALPNKHFEVATAANIALIVQVKGNQPTLHQRVQEISATTPPLGSAHSRDKGRNRDERRSVAVFDPTSKLADTDWHPHVAAVIRVEREVFTRNAKTGLLRHSTEAAFYVANTPVTATRAAEAIRAHWRIETTSHYSRDVTSGEDRSRIRTNPVSGSSRHHETLVAALAVFSMAAWNTNTFWLAWLASGAS